LNFISSFFVFHLDYLPPSFPTPNIGFWLLFDIQTNQCFKKDLGWEVKGNLSQEVSIRLSIYGLGSYGSKMVAHPHNVVKKRIWTIGFPRTNSTQDHSLHSQKLDNYNNKTNSRIPQACFQVKPYHTHHFKHNYLAQPDKIKSLHTMFIVKLT